MTTPAVRIQLAWFITMVVVAAKAPVHNDSEFVFRTWINNTGFVDYRNKPIAEHDHTRSQDIEDLICHKGHPWLHDRQSVYSDNQQVLM
jgi:hypothetical protein